MAVHIDVIAELRERRLRRDVEKLKRDAEKYGDEIGRKIGKGVERAYRGVEQANTRLAKSNDNLKKTTEASTAAQERHTIAHRNWEAAQVRHAKAAREAAAAQAVVNKMFADGVTDLDKLKAAGEDNIRTHKALVRANEALIDTGFKVSESNRQSAESTRQASAALRDHTAVLREVQRANREVEYSFEDLAKSNRVNVGNMNKDLQDFGTKAFLTMRGVAHIAVPGVLKVMYDAGTAVAYAAKSIWLLPAAAAAAGAGIGTLAIATHGFADTIENMGDPKKFAEGLAMLSPNAQQAALSIKALVDGPLGELKRATQDAFFDNVGAQLEQLSGAYTPVIQSMTESIATTFNTMFSDVSGMLMTPEAQGSIGTITTNISTAFQNAAPAAQSFADALLRITEVGSNFLPGIGTAIANAAQSFSDFIAEAERTGDLKRWIDEGITAVSSLADGIWSLSTAVYDFFAAGGMEGVTRFQQDLEIIADLINLASLDTEAWGDKWREELDSMYGPLGTLRDGIMDIPEALNWVGDRTVDFANHFKNAFLNGPIRALNAFLTHATKLLNLLPGEDRPEDFGHLTEIPDISYDGVPTNDWGGHQRPSAVDDSGRNARTQRERRGLPPPGRRTDRPTQTQRPVPDVPADGGRAPSETDILNDIKSKMDPGAYAVDPFGGMNLPPGMDMSAIPTTGGPTGPSMYPSASGETSGYDALLPGTKSLEAILREQFPELGTIGGVRGDDHPDHPSGRALDIMIPGGTTMGGANPQGKMLGDEIWDFLMSTGAVDPSGSLWQTMTGGNHFDHIHARLAEGMENVTTDSLYSPLTYGGGSPYEQGGLGYYEADQGAIIDARNNVIDRAHTLEEAKKDLAAMEQSGLKTEEELKDQRWKVYEAEREWRDAQRKLGEAMNGQFKKLDQDTKNTLGQIGVELDADFGISQGLAGIADNLTRFLGNLAFAPMMGQLSAIQAANPIQGGHGIIGQMGAQNLAAGRSPFFGRQLGAGTNGGLASLFGGPTMDPGRQLGRHRDEGIWRRLAHQPRRPRQHRRPTDQAGHLGRLRRPRHRACALHGFERRPDRHRRKDPRRAGAASMGGWGELRTSRSARLQRGRLGWRSA
jgi:hypothetical protein